MNNPAPIPYTRRRIISAGVGGLLVSGSVHTNQIARAQGEAIDLALILAIDCSYSVNRTEYNLQTQGLAIAFLDPEIIKAATSGPTGRIAVAVMQWSSEASQRLAVPWIIVDGAQSALQLSSSLSAMPRVTADGATALGDALAAAGNHLDNLPFRAFRRVIDVSGDGRKNTGSVVTPVRDSLIRRGVTINALAILNEDPELDLYYANNLVGGIGSFTMVANDYQEYRTAIRKKLLREIRFVPVSDAGQRPIQTPPA